MAMGTLRDLLASGMSPEEINALLSQSNVSTAGFDPMGTTGRGEPYMPPPEPQGRPGTVEQAPLNTIRNNSTGRTFAPTDMYGQPSQSQPAGPITDPTRGYVDTPFGKGMYMKADPLKVVLGDGRIVDLGRDTTAERARTKENLALDAQRATIAETQAKTAALGAKPTEPEALRTIKGAMEIYKSLPDGDMKRAFGEKYGLETKGVDEKPLPISAAKGLLENQQNLRRAQQALALIKGNNVGSAVGDENATGWKGYAPDSMLQRMDPQGVDTRAAIGDIGSLVIHQRSGAAVTASEFPRLKPFIPLHTDDPETARKKLKRFVDEYQNIASETSDFYKESGFKVPTETLKNAAVAPRESASGPVRVTAINDAMKLPSGTEFIDPNGVTRRRP